MDRRPDSGRGDGKDSWDSYDTVFLNSKAGMDGVDKKKVQKVVYEMSKGSRYFDNEQRKQAAAEQRVQAMTLQAASLAPAQLAAYEKEADLKIAELEASRDLSRIWLHVDMDAFYAAVETLEDASLASKPMAVGGMSMICTANYEARKFGVRAAMPGFIARKLCPDLVFVRPDFEKYTRYSEMSRQVFRTYDANFVAGSLDEAYLDITNSCRSRNLSAAEVAEELRDGVHKATGLTCSAGVGPNRLLAKVCSDIKKPNGQFVLSNDRAAVMAFISSLPIRKVSGIGKVTEGQLKDVLGISTCADLLTKRSYISALFSRISTDFFLAVALGVGGSEPPRDEPRKSLSNERTFPAISREVDLFSKLEELAHALAEDMQKEDLQGRTLTLKLKTTEFEVRTRAVTLPSFVYLKEDVLLHASKLLKGELPITVRLMGLRMSHFKGEKVESADRTQRTLTSFLPHLPASESCRTEVRQNPSDELDTDDATILSSCEGDFARKSGSSHDDHLRGTSNGEVNGGIAKQDLTKATSELSCDATPTKRHGKDLLLNGQKTMDFILFKQRAGASKSGDCGECLDTCKQGSGSDIPASESQQLLHQFPGAPVAVRSHFRADACQASTSAMADLRGGGILTQDGYSLQEHIWVEDRCSLCGIQVNDCLPSARQEHEDYHFALALQKEGASVSTPFASQSRRNEREAVNKRKLTAMKRQHTPTKEGGHVPIEAYFNRVHSGSSEQTKRSR